MNVDEFLIKIGVDATQANKINDVINLLISLTNKADETGKDLVSSMKDVGSTSKKAMEETASGATKAESKVKKLKIAFAAIVAGAVLFGKRIANAFNGAIDNVKNLIGQQNGLFKITQRDLNQAKQYQMAMNKTRLVIESVATKIALTLAPAITNIANGFSKWLVANKDLVVNGISVVIKFATGFVQLITNGLKAIGFVIEKTIGWKSAMLALAAAFIYFKRAFLLSPIGLIVGAIAAILLIIDDLMVYLEGGESYFGKYWQPLIDGARAVYAWFKALPAPAQKIISVLGGLFALLLGGQKTFFLLGFAVGKVLKPFILLGKNIISLGSIFVKSFGVIVSIVRAASSVMMANPILAIVTAIAAAAYLIYRNWDELKAFFSEFWSSVTRFFKNSIKDILMYFGMSEDGAEDTVNAIGDIFGAIIDFITAPFKAAWDLISGLFGVWTDDTTSFTEKLGKSFSNIFGKLTAPFKKAKEWIGRVFGGFVDGIMSKVNKGLSFVGLGSNSDTEKNSEETDEYGDRGENYKAFLNTIQPSMLTNPNIPMKPLSTSKYNSVNQNMNNSITINTSDTKVGVEQAGDLLLQQLQTANNNALSGLGVN